VNSQAKPFSRVVIKPLDRVLKEANQLVQDGMSDLNMALKTRWSGYNRLMLGGMRFGNNYLLAGASGHGKSYFLNMLLQDFLDPTLNVNFNKSFKILHFGFEMSAADEILRRASAMTDISYANLLSAYDKLTPQQYEFFQSKIESMRQQPIYFVEQPTTRYKIYQTIKDFKAKFPDDELIVTLDHTLLVQPEVGENEIQTLAGLGKLFIEIRKEFNTMNILLGQLNDKIESEKRLDPTNPSLHYPTKTDIHGSKQIYHAVDVAMVIHQPSLLHLEYYGKKDIPTNNLVALHVLKNRKGEQGLTLLKNNLVNGKFDEWDYERPPTLGYGYSENE
jgi:replicative DNA helicase